LNTNSIIALCFAGFSVLLLAAVFLFLKKKDSLIPKYIRICTGFYISGTLLILLITFIKSNLPGGFTWLSEIFVFGIYAASCGMVFYTIKKFAGADKPAANGDVGKN
jgi:asparagine N-glycosylation enzyme membrane subunit Stt3